MTKFRILAASDISQPQRPAKRDTSTSGRILETSVDDEGEETRPTNRCLRLVLQPLGGGPSLVSACELVPLLFGAEALTIDSILEVTDAEESHGVLLLTPSTARLLSSESAAANHPPRHPPPPEPDPIDYCHIQIGDDFLSDCELVL